MVHFEGPFKGPLGHLKMSFKGFGKEPSTKNPCAEDLLAYDPSKKPEAEVLEPDPSEKSDPWTDWQKEQLPVVQETPPADNEAGWDWQNLGLAEQPARPKPLSDVEPYYKLRRTGNVDNAEATGAATPMHDEQD